MTTQNQAAIKALTRYDHAISSTGSCMEDMQDGCYLRYDDVLAALQAAPAQGSIDTPEFDALLEEWRLCTGRPGQRSTRAALVAYIDAHIAQRAPSGDEEDEDARRETWKNGYSIGFEAAKGLFAAPAPIADEVAGAVKEVRGAERALGSLVIGARAREDGAGVDFLVQKLGFAVDALGKIIERPPAPKAGAPEQHGWNNFMFPEVDADLLPPKASAPDAPTLTMTTEWTEGAATGSLSDEKGNLAISGDNLHVNAQARASIAENMEMVRDLIESKGYKVTMMADTSDAPAGDLPLLPKPGTYYIDIPNWGREYNTIDEFSNSEFDGYGAQLFTADQMRDYVLADRAARGDHLKRMRKLLDAARAAAAPAGHAEPWAWGYETPMSDGSVFKGASVERLTIGVGVTPDSTERPLFAAPVAAEPAPADPMDWKLPCDVPVGSGKHHKGTTLRTLVTRIDGLHRMAMNGLPKVTPEARAAFEACFVGGKPAPAIPAQPGIDMRAAVKAAFEALLDEVIADDTATSPNPFSAGRWAGINDLKRAILAQQEAPRAPGCGCATCRPITLDDMRMVLCPTCGNKRCPKATDHRNKCTNSNEPGQVGSSHE